MGEYQRVTAELRPINGEVFGEVEKPDGGTEWVALVGMSLGRGPTLRAAVQHLIERNRARAAEVEAALLRALEACDG